MDYSWIKLGVKAVVIDSKYPVLNGEIVVIAGCPDIYSNSSHETWVGVEVEEGRSLAIKAGYSGIIYPRPEHLKPLKEDDDKLYDWQGMVKSSRFHTLFESEKKIRELQVGEIHETNYI